MNHHRPCLLSLTAPFVLAASPVSAQQYSLDDWLSVQRVRSFVVSPDGRQFYYTAGPAESGTTEIFRIGRDGGQAVQISSNAEGVRPEPKEGVVISADGRTLYYTTPRYFQNFDNIFSLPGSPRRERSEFGGSYAEMPEEYDERSPIQSTRGPRRAMLRNFSISLR